MTKRLEVYLSDEEYEAVRRLSAGAYATMSAWARAAILTVANTRAQKILTVDPQSLRPLGHAPIAPPGDLQRTISGAPKTPSVSPFLPPTFKPFIKG